MQISRRSFVAQSIFVSAAIATFAGSASVLAKTPKPKRGGLGHSEKVWIKLWGKPDETPIASGQAPYVLKQTGYELDFPFWDDDETQPIIGFTTFARDLMSPDDIQTATIQYTPEDSKEIETYPHPNGLDTVARYNSASLVKMMATFDSAGLNWFPNGDPGDFVLILHPADADPSRIDTVDVGLGNNP